MTFVVSRLAVTSTGAVVVAFRSIVTPSKTMTPPPALAAVLVSMIESVIDTSASAKKRPAPQSAVLPETVLSTMSTVQPSAPRAPPRSAASFAVSVTPSSSRAAVLSQ